MSATARCAVEGSAHAQGDHTGRGGSRRSRFQRARGGGGRAARVRGSVAPVLRVGGDRLVRVHGAGDGNDIDGRSPRGRDHRARHRRVGREHRLGRGRRGWPHGRELHDARCGSAHGVHRRWWAGRRRLGCQPARIRRCRWMVLLPRRSPGRRWRWSDRARRLHRSAGQCRRGRGRGRGWIGTRGDRGAESRRGRRRRQPRIGRAARAGRWIRPDTRYGRQRRTRSRGCLSLRR